MWNEPEYNDAAKMVKARKEQEARLAEEAKREEQARGKRRQSMLDSLVTNGKDSLRSFTLTDRIDFNKQEAKAIYYGNGYCSKVRFRPMYKERCFLCRQQVSRRSILEWLHELPHEVRHQLNETLCWK